MCVDVTPPTASLNLTFSCSSGLRVYVDCEDDISTCDYTWKHTTSSSEPSSFPKSSSKYKSDALDGKNYLWVNVIWMIVVILPKKKLDILHTKFVPTPMVVVLVAT